MILWPEATPHLLLKAREFTHNNMLEVSQLDLNVTGNPTLHRAVRYFTGRLTGRIPAHEMPAPETDLFVECFGEEILSIE
jgi:hypothetical protein